MDLPEMFVSALVSLLVESLAPGTLSFIPYAGIDEKLKEWRKTLLTIEAVLADAEDKQFAEKSIQLWLHDVQKLAYVIDDFVDDLATEARRRQMMAEPESSRSNKILKIVSGLFSSITPTAFSFSYDMIRKIDEITNSLKELEKTKSILSLKECVGGKSEKKADLRLPSTSLVGPSLVYGREEDTAAILALLLKDRLRDHGNGNVHIISIVGMGGIGKTTLAQSLYNNEGVKDCFDDRMWVCVTEDFNVFKISKIINAATEERCEFIDLNKVQEKLREKLSNKKFLLVLDDVWNEDYEKWDLLCTPFRAGAPGSTIIVTTRNLRVAQTISSNSKEIHELNKLSDGDCLSLLAQHALQRPNFDSHPGLKEVGKIIAKQCQGLPLAAKSLGGLLRTKPSSKQWKEVSTSRIWKLQNDAVIPALRLSYHHLPPHLKPLFVYCSLFPKGYEFEKQELIMLWMAQGFLNQSLGEKKQMEELGCEYFCELLSRSFFQLSSENKSRYIMHDLTNDLAQFVASLTYLRLDDNMVKSEQYKVSEEARHASFISSYFDDHKKIKAFNASFCLRTLLPIHKKSSSRSHLSNLAIKDFPWLPCLRALSLNNYQIDDLPRSIGDLKHLRYLDFSRTDVTELPESVCDLYNLQTLLLHGCSRLSKLPASIQKLINLRHLGISDTPSLKEMPMGIGTLTHLHTLSKFIVDKSDGQKISELKGLHLLQGTLSITGLENVINVQDAMEANLLRKEGLLGLEMKWSSRFRDTQGLEFEVLDALKSQTGLESLQIEFYGAHNFPSWIGDHSFCYMVKVRLAGCQNCTHLPPLGQLSSLKELFIEEMNSVKIVGPEFIGAGFPGTKAFQSLLILSFCRMDGWEEWTTDSTTGDEIFKGVFPCLQDLQIFSCKKLEKISLPKIPSLTKIRIYYCRLTVLRIIVGLGSVKKLEIEGISRLTKLDEGIIGCLGEVEDLSVSGCDELRYLWEEDVACQVLEKLKSLSVAFCPQLESLGYEEQLLPQYLETLELSNCDKLEKMPNWQNSLMSLRQLTIECCMKLQDNLASTAYLEPKIEYHIVMDMAQSSSGGEHGNYEFSTLEMVYIRGCTNLKCFPTGKKLPITLRNLFVLGCENMNWSNQKLLTEAFSHLTHIDIAGCLGLELIPETSLPPTLVSLYIDDCKNLKHMLCANEMQSFTSLRRLKIVGCENLEGYPNGRWPPNLILLVMGEVKQLITEWGLATLPTSLHELVLRGEFPQLVSFSKVETQLPRSIKRLHIVSLKNLESLGEDLDNLSSLQILSFNGCPKLGELPKSLLPTLSCLRINNCPLLEERCRKEKTDYWPKISHIPRLTIESIGGC